MPTLSLTSKGEVTLSKEMLKHLGVEGGGTLELDLLPGGRAVARPRPAGSIKDLIVRPDGHTTDVAALEQIDEVIAKGRAE